jgi:hypothetical protein
MEQACRSTVSGWNERGKHLRICQSWFFFNAIGKTELVAQQQSPLA